MNKKKLDDGLALPPAIPINTPTVNIKLSKIQPKISTYTVYQPIACPPAPIPNISIEDSSATTINTSNNIMEEGSTAINNNKHKDTIETITEEKFVNLRLVLRTILTRNQPKISPPTIVPISLKNNLILKIQPSKITPMHPP